MTPRVLSRRFVAAVVLALPFLFGQAAVVTVHAELVEVSPEADATVAGSPDEIVATFSEALEADGSGIRLRGAAGESVATGDVDPADPTRLAIDDVPDLAPGVYEVRWTAASDDGHIERGTWTFTVQTAATPVPTATPAPTAAATDDASPSTAATERPSPSASASEPPSDPGDPGEPASSTTDVLIPIIVLLALVAIGGVYFLRRGWPSR